MGIQLCETNAFQETSSPPTHRLTGPFRIDFMRVSALFSARLPPLSGFFFSGGGCAHAARCIAALLLSALAGGCAPAKPPPSAVNLSGFPPAFRDGYAAGCDSAKRGGAPRRDETRFAQDRQYAAGWRDGLDVCKKKP